MTKLNPIEMRGKLTKEVAKDFGAAKAKTIIGERQKQLLVKGKNNYL